MNRFKTLISRLYLTLLVVINLFGVYVTGFIVVSSFNSEKNLQSWYECASHLVGPKLPALDLNGSGESYAKKVNFFFGQQISKRMWLGETTQFSEDEEIQKAASTLKNFVDGKEEPWSRPISHLLRYYAKTESVGSEINSFLDFLEKPTKVLMLQVPGIGIYPVSEEASPREVASTAAYLFNQRTAIWKTFSGINSACSAFGDLDFTSEHSWVRFTPHSVSHGLLRSDRGGVLNSFLLDVEEATHYRTLSFMLLTWFGYLLGINVILISFRRWIVWMSK